MSKPQLYCVVGMERVIFVNSFADVLDFFEKEKQLLEIYKWNSSGYEFYCCLSN